MVEVVRREADLVDENHGVRRRAVDQAEGHRAVRGVVERTLALDEDPVPHRLALLHEPLDGPVEEVADDTVDRDAPAVDHHAGLAARHEDGPVAGLERRPA